jgi:hypothetical protein
MNQQEFDKHIADKLAQQHFVPKEQSWLALQSQLAAAQKEALVDETPIVASGSKWWLKVAAVLLPLVALWGVYQYNTSKQIPTIVAVNTTNTQANTTKIATDTNATIVVADNTITEKAVVDYLQQHPIQLPTNWANTNDANLSIKNKTATIAQPNAPTNTVVNNNIIAQQQPKITEQVTEKVPEIIAPKTAIASIPNTTSEKNYLPLDLSTPNKAKPVNKKVGISILAGMQTNTRTYYSNGIQLGIAAQKNISKKLYVDAAISISSNNPSWLQSSIVSPTELRNSIASVKNGNSVSSIDAPSDFINAYGVNPANNTFSANGNTIPISELTDDVTIAEAAVYRLASNQLEIAPTVGYQFSKRIKLAGGVDAAKIITTNAYQKSVDLLLLQSQSAPAVRSWDMGAVAKVEYAISKKILVGYRHRQGLTNMASSTSTRRSYNGVILKYQFH